MNICPIILQVIPLCWCLMQNKSQAAYEAVLLLIRDNLGAWNFISVVCDFEDGMINAFRSIFNTDVQGACFMLQMWVKSGNYFLSLLCNLFCLSSNSNNFDT